MGVYEPDGNLALYAICCLNFFRRERLSDVPKSGSPITQRLVKNLFFTQDKKLVLEKNNMIV